MDEEIQPKFSSFHNYPGDSQQFGQCHSILLSQLAALLILGIV